MITAEKAVRFAKRAQRKTLGSVDVASAVQKAEADLTRDIRRAADLGRFSTMFNVRSLPVAERLRDKAGDLGYHAVLIPGELHQTIGVSWPPED